MSRVRDHGGARLKAIIWLLILGAFVYICVKVIPLYLDYYQLEDKMKTEARFAAVNRRTDEELRNIIFREVQERDIPARREDIHVEQSQRGVRISLDYSVTVDLKLYQWTLQFHPSADNARL